MRTRGRIINLCMAVLLLGCQSISPLHKAAYEGDTKTVLSLIGQGQGAETEGYFYSEYDQATVLSAAVAGGHFETVRALLEKGTSVDQRDLSGRSPLHWASSTGQAQMVEFLLDRGVSPNVTNNAGDTPLHFAARLGRYEVAKLLLARGANPNARDQSGGTPLFYAAAEGKVELVELMLTKGADPNSAKDWTPLHFAAYYGSTRIVRLLLAHGAATDLSDTKGRTPAMIAEKRGHPSIARLLQQAEARELDLARASAAPPQVAAVPTPIMPTIQSEVDRVPALSSLKKKHAYAVVIGIEQYREKLPKADYADRDAKLVGEYLTKVMGYPEENVIVQVNERATGRDLEKYFESWLPNNVEKDGSVFVYYSGHGSPSAKSGDAYLVPYDGDPAFLETTGYPLKRLYAALEKLPAGEVTVVLDSCFSGAGGRSVIAQGLRPMGLSVQKAMKASGKTIVLSASSGEQVSSTYMDQGHGLMTYFFLKGLQGEGDTNHDGVIELAELFEYVKPNVQRIARKQYNNEQTPQLLANPEATKRGGGRLVDRAKQ